MPAKAPGSSICEWCDRYSTLVRNAQHVRKHVATPTEVADRADFARWAEASTLCCAYCSAPEYLLYTLDIKTQVGRRLRRLGIDRVDNDRAYTIDNIVWCCFACNKAKSNTFSGSEMERVGSAIAEVWRARLRAAKCEDPWTTS